MESSREKWRENRERWREIGRDGGRIEEIKGKQNRERLKGHS